jgi:hypothetical protein
MQLKKTAKEVKLSSQDAKEINDEVAYLNTITQMPITLELLHQKLNANNYAQLKEDFTFQNRRTLVCVDCYLQLVVVQNSRLLRKARDDFDF